MNARVVSIGCSSGFWGDSPHAAAQLVESGRIRYLVSDYLAEITMSLLARARLKSPEAGYPPDFVESLAPLLPEIRRQGIRVVSNAGGMNPEGCRAALEKAAAEAGIPLRIAVVQGDDLMPRIDEIRRTNPRHMTTGEPLPARLTSCNAYLGALPIAAALDAGADVVLTGRGADSAVTLGILMHELGWAADDYDKLAAGSLAGHLIECGPQCTGGIFTDWASVPGWENMGYPIVECMPDGSCVVTKPPGTGGLVTPATVAEQLVYEIGDPSAYILPDVVCDFTQVKLSQEGPDRVLVTGARGRAPTPDYKVSATFADGFRVLTTLLVAGGEAAARARRMGEAIVERARNLARRHGHADFSEVSLEIIGAEDTYAPAHRRIAAAREVVLKMGLRHPDRAPLELFAREMIQAGVAMAQGTTGLFGGRPSPAPVLRLFSFLLDKQAVPVSVQFEGQARQISIPAGRPLESSTPEMPVEAEVPAGPTVRVPLARFAWARSGDKGNDANIGVIARRPQFVPLLRRELTEAKVADFFAHVLRGTVKRWELPGIHAFNFLLTDALGGGGMASLRYDPQGKTYGQMLLDLPIEVPATWVDADGALRDVDVR